MKPTCLFKRSASQETRIATGCDRFADEAKWIKDGGQLIPHTQWQSLLHLGTASGRAQTRGKGGRLMTKIKGLQKDIDEISERSSDITLIISGRVVLANANQTLICENRISNSLRRV